LRPPCHELVALPFDSGPLRGDSRPPRILLAGRSNRLDGGSGVIGERFAMRDEELGAQLAILTAATAPRAP
jgi:hypothetical protein